MTVTTLGLFSPGSPPSPEALAAGCDWLRAEGFVLRSGQTAVAGRGLHAAPPEHRARDLMDLLDDPSVDAVLCTRGGSGTPGILPFLDWSRVARQPKPIIGLSDVTALHLARYARTGYPGLSGAVLTQLSAVVDPYTRARWLAEVRGLRPSGPVPLPSGITLEPLPPAGPPAEAEGILFPCNLSLLTSLIGTPYLPDLSGAILVLEEIHETPQSLDRMVSMLHLSGVDAGLRGVVLGQFTECHPRNASVTEEEGREVVRSWARSLGVPVIAGFPYGHEPVACTLPFGVPARLTLSPPGLELRAVQLSRVP